MELGQNPMVYITLIFSLSLIVWTLFKGEDEGNSIFEAEVGTEEDNAKSIIFFDSFWSAIAAGILSLFICLTITYFNWYDVGEFPLSPVSPPNRSRHNHSDILHSTKYTGNNVVIAHWTAALLSISVAGLILLNSQYS